MRCVALLCGLTVAAFAQEAELTFDVASIRPAARCRWWTRPGSRASTISRWNMDSTREQRTRRSKGAGSLPCKSPFSNSGCGRRVIQEPDPDNRIV